MHYVICCYGERAESICLIWSLGTAESGPISVKKQKKKSFICLFCIAPFDSNQEHRDPRHSFLLHVTSIVSEFYSSQFQRSLT